MHNNYIFTGGNHALVVTNIDSIPFGTNTLSGLPLGTSDGTATGELALKVLTIGNSNVSSSQLIGNIGNYVAGKPVITAQRSPQTIKSLSTATTGSTAVWTPASGSKFRLMRFMLLTTGNASVSGGATITITLKEGTTSTGIAIPVFLPTLAGTILVNTNITSGWIDLGLGYLSSTDGVLNLNLSGALTTGTITILCCGTEEV